MGGVSLRAHLEQLEAQTGETPEGLDGPELPEALAHVWLWFTELSNARQSGFSGVQPISFQDIDAWKRLTGAQPSPDEVALLRQLDDLFRRHVSEQLKPKAPTPQR